MDAVGGWRCSLKSLLKTLETAMRLSPEALAKKGERGKQLVSEQFTWDRIAIQMAEVYEWVASNRLSPRPSCLR